MELLNALFVLVVGQGQQKEALLNILSAAVPTIFHPGSAGPRNVLVKTTIFPLWITAMHYAVAVSWSVKRSRIARYPERRPAGVVPAGDGSLDIDQVWMGTQLLQHVADHAIADSGCRRFLLQSDQEGRTWVSVAAPLRRMPRRHRRRSRRGSRQQEGDAEMMQSPARAPIVDAPVATLDHVSVSSEDDGDDDATGHASAAFPGRGDRP